MSQQEIAIVADKGGSIGGQVLRILTPRNSAAAPAVNAEYLGQVHVDTATPAVYIAIKVGDATPANDWQRIDAYDA